MNAHTRGAHAQSLLKLSEGSRADLLTSHPCNLPIRSVEEDCGIELEDSSSVPVMPKTKDRAKTHGLNKLHNTGEHVGVGLDELKRDSSMRVSKPLTSSHRGENICLYICPEPRIHTVGRNLKLVCTPKLAVGIKCDLGVVGHNSVRVKHRLPGDMNRMHGRSIISGSIITSPRGRGRAPSLAANTQLNRASHRLLHKRVFLLKLLFDLLVNIVLNLIGNSLFARCGLGTGRFLR